MLTEFLIISIYSFQTTFILYYKNHAHVTFNAYYTCKLVRKIAFYDKKIAQSGWKNTVQG